jgi:DtxR family Mn-dependent transcriptional regulator
MLAISPPSVTDMAQRLGAAGLVNYKKHQGVVLTAEGEAIALDILRRHRLIELYLVEELGYAPYEVHDEADKLEHAVSDRFVAELARKLGDPDFDPHGDPIPAADGTIIQRDLHPLSELPPDTPATIARYKTNNRDLLQHILERGLELDAHVEVKAKDPFDGPITVSVGQTTQIIGHKIASLVLVDKLGPLRQNQNL